jgi:sugar/nucleoside kinase (ribokinase family)
MLVTCTGILVADIFAVDLPKVSDPGELTFVPKGIEMYAGGHSANVSIDLRKIGLGEGEVSSVGAVGEDLFGDFVEGVLRSHGVVTHLQRVRGVGTSKDLILVVRGQDRRYHVDIGANWYLDPGHVRSVLAEESPIILYVGAPGMLGKFDKELAEILRKSKDGNCLTFVDPVTPHSGKWESILGASKWTDIFHCNSLEASSMTGHQNPSKAAEALVREGIGLVIVTMGERGLIAKSSRFTLEMPALKVPIIDPSGAGDAFCSGMIHGLAEKTETKSPDISSLSPEDLCEVILEGAAAGAACVTATGATTSVNRENVERLLREHGSEILQNTSIIAR